MRLLEEENSKWLLVYRVKNLASFFRLIKALDIKVTNFKVRHCQKKLIEGTPGKRGWKRGHDRVGRQDKNDKWKT